MATTYIKVPVSGGDPDKSASKDLPPVNKARGVQDDTADIRDLLSGLVAKGNTLAGDDKASMMARLNVLVGKDKASKIMDHVYLFNQHPEIAKLSTEDKLRHFYDLGSNDADVNGIIGKAKSFGYGPVAGFNTSSNSLNQQASGAIPVSVPTASLSPEVTKKIMVKLPK